MHNQFYFDNHLVGCHGCHVKMVISVCVCLSILYTFSSNKFFSPIATSSFPLCSINCFSHGSNSNRTSASSPRSFSVSSIRINSMSLSYTWYKNNERKYFNQKRKQKDYHIPKALFFISSKSSSSLTKSSSNLGISSFNLGIRPDNSSISFVESFIFVVSCK